MIETDISDALQTAVIDAVSASVMPGLLIKAIGRTGPGVETYLEIVQIVNNRSGDYWDTSQVYQGGLRLILHWPVNDEGAIPAGRVRDSIAGYFVKGAVFSSGAASVMVYDNPTASGVIENGSELLLPVTVPYRDFKPS